MSSSNSEGLTLIFNLLGMFRDAPPWVTGLVSEGLLGDEVAGSDFALLSAGSHKLHTIEKHTMDDEIAKF